jgi:hypothetical protein
MCSTQRRVVLNKINHESVFFLGLKIKQACYVNFQVDSSLIIYPLHNKPAKPLAAFADANESVS